MLTPRPLYTAMAPDALLYAERLDTTMIYTHVLNRGTGVLSPLDVRSN
jgi:hypothetical protein